MVEFINGANVALSLTAGLLFLRFWTQTRDRLFLFFAIAMGVLGVNRAALVLLPMVASYPSEHNVVFYMVRLVAFLVILAAIIDKDRRRSAGSTMPRERAEGEDKRPQ
jgi:hypothetical protein